MKSFGKYRAQACAILGENSSADILNNLTWKLGTMDIQKVLTAKDAEMALAAKDAEMLLAAKDAETALALAAKDAEMLLAAKHAEMLLAAKDAEMLLALTAKDAEMDSYRSSAKKALASKDMRLDDADSEFSSLGSKLLTSQVVLSFRTVISAVLIGYIILCVIKVVFYVFYVL